MEQRGLVRVLALLFAFSMIAAACGGSSDSDGGSDDNGDNDTEEESGPATTTVATETTAAEAADGPVKGGNLVYGVEADSANPWAPYRVSCANACYVVLNTISDPLFNQLEAGGEGGTLVEEATTNEDFTVHTWKIREGITFHDGTPLDGAAVAFNMNTCRFSGLTGGAFLNISDVQSEGQTVTMTTSAPWFPATNSFAGGQCSFMFSPTWLSSLPDIPFRTEGAPWFSEEIAATPADGDPAAPVGLGAFKFESYSPGNGNSFKAVAYEDYWRGPNGITGEELPYLDSVEIVVAVDVASRSSALSSGQFDIIHTSNSDEIKVLQDDDSINLIAANDFGATNHIMLNSAQGTNETLGGIEMDPEGVNATSPLLHLSCRKALAHATNTAQLAEERGAGLVEPANGPFGPGSIGYLDDTGYPEYDVEAAQTEMEQCKIDAGTDVIQFSFQTTNDPFNVETNQIVIEMWKESFGDSIDVSVTPVEQGAYIGLALVGAYQALSWRAYGGVDPDSQYIWWNSGTAAPIGTIGLNFARFQDPVIDENLRIQRESSDPDVRREAAEAINRSFGENVWNLWTSWTLWAVVSNPPVQSISTASTPEGDALRGVIGGVHRMSQIWCLEGSCQG